MTSTTVLIYREWLQLLRFGSISVGINRVVDKEAKSVQLLDLLTYTPEIDYRDKTSLIACEFTALQSDAKVEICVEDVLSWIPLSQATLTDLEPEAERLKCHLAKSPWGTSYEEFVRETYRSKLKGVLERWLSSFQLEGDFETANFQKVELPRVREISFPGKPFSGTYYAIEGHAHDKPFDLKESAKRFKAEFLQNQYTGFGGYPKQLEYADLLTNSKDQGFTLLALALLYTYTSLEKGLLDFCTFHNDVIWLSEKTTAQEALNVASIVGRHHGPEYMTGIFCSSSNKNAFVEDREVTAYLATFQHEFTKGKPQSTGGEDEQDVIEAVVPSVDQATDGAVTEDIVQADDNTQKVVEDSQSESDSGGNDSHDTVAAGERTESTNEPQADSSSEQSEQPNSKSASESTDVAEALTEPCTKSMTDNDAAIATDHSDHGTKEANQNTDSMDGVVEAVETPKSEANADSDTAPTDDKPKDAIGDGDPSYQGHKHDTPSQEPDENYTSGTPETVPVSDLGEADGKLDESSDSGALELPRVPRSQAKSNRKGNNSVKRSQSGSGSQKSNDKTAGNSVSIETGLFSPPDDEAKVN